MPPGAPLLSQCLALRCRMMDPETGRLSPCLRLVPRALVGKSLCRALSLGLIVRGADLAPVSGYFDEIFRDGRNCPDKSVLAFNG